MKYTVEQLGFILYNNRSVDGVVKNFIDKSIDVNKLLDIEKKFDWCKSLYSNLEKMVEVDLSLLDPDGDDEIVTPIQISELSDLVLSNIGRFSVNEKYFLTNRNINSEIIEKYQLLGLSNFTNREHLRIIGATCHPILKTFLKDGIEEGGIVFPLFENGKLVNCSIRRITDVGKLKYTLAVPDIPVWNLESIKEGDEICISEGIFDMISLIENGFKAVSPSSAMWSGIQLYKLLDKKPSRVTIFCDNDRVGLKTGLVLSKFFNLVGIESKTIHSKFCKYAAEHFFEKEFDFLRYLQKRKF